MEQSIDARNARFWNELCGSIFAQKIGIKDHSIESLRRFDEAYLNFYPYLLKEVVLDDFAGKKILEIGLGYGTLGQKIIEAGAHYTGLDIAEGPVKMVHHRLALQHLPGAAVRGNILGSPFQDSTFDVVVSIGCFHHTGSTEKCIQETFRILKPGGMAYIMLYNQFSFRQWSRWPVTTLLSLLSTLGGIVRNSEVDERQRRSYDSNSTGQSAPETTFHSIHELRGMFSRFTSVRFSKQNCDDIRLFPRVAIPRKYLLSSIGRKMGLDIYIQAVK